MDTALPQKFSFVLDRNLAKANCTENHVCSSCDKEVLGSTAKKQISDSDCTTKKLHNIKEKRPFFLYDLKGKYYRILLWLPEGIFYYSDVFHDAFIYLVSLGVLI